MPQRFIFRQVHFADIPTFLRDGEIRAKNHEHPQVCHQASYQSIVNRRGTAEFELPAGVVNDYVPFYFSPITSFTYTIHQGNVPSVAPSGEILGVAKDDDRVFFVFPVDLFRGSGLDYCFSDYALNSQAPLPSIETDLDKLEAHVHWNVFDDTPYIASIPEIGYAGVCRWFQNAATPPTRQLRSQKRMAEFLVKRSVPLNLACCLVAKSSSIGDNVSQMMAASRWNIPIITKRGCYF
ncbi:DarT ssDNA thymidine ADP-ribosyltransferase family protein [Agrobacterium sp. rho-13.3]|uniref:DarT ssDNA thymidine ADP-ribosyltransferase family protein n=1 Tax=Agrobacterium sp. rho-13.3 TaxID=3072980 RepID=UPI002A1007DC|nr:DarT ssDNA thymidine ADP-ribosyltransferase family protein [Agrobacterium sp. rho-13.3]MDX8309037.1 DarT ssDNA thymidine ADP-ribosyltransferase family protein [Agrobacterium sp. rho-13.3]